MLYRLDSAKNDVFYIRNSAGALIKVIYERAEILNRIITVQLNPDYVKNEQKTHESSEPLLFQVDKSHSCLRTVKVTDFNQI